MVQMAGLQQACPQVIRLPVDKWHTPALANQMVAELLQQSRPGSPGLYAIHGAAATLGPLWPHYGDVSYPAHSRGIGAEVPARPVRFRRHARRLGWGGSDHVLRQGTGMSTEDRKALLHRLVAEVFNEGRLEVLDELYEPGAASRARRGLRRFVSRSAILSW